MLTKDNVTIEVGQLLYGEDGRPFHIMSLDEKNGWVYGYTRKSEHIIKLDGDTYTITKRLSPSWLTTYDPTTHHEPIGAINDIWNDFLRAADEFTNSLKKTQAQLDDIDDSKKKPC